MTDYNLLATIGSAVITGLGTWFITKSSLNAQNQNLTSTLIDKEERLRKETEKAQTIENENKKLNQKLGESTSKIEKLNSSINKIRESLERSNVITDHLQTVILCGPRAVGKTSLMSQLHVPWDHSSLSPTAYHRSGDVPVFYCEGERIPHFADETIKVKNFHNIMLKIHDFPGELSYQKDILSLLNQEADKDNGIVLICMFDAQEAYFGISKETNDYYNGDLFKQLRQLSSFKLDIIRIIFVFNKIDKLKISLKLQKNDEVLRYCLEKYKDLLLLFSGIVNSEKVCEVLAILGRENMILENLGTPIIKGEASREIVKRILGSNRLNEIIETPATTNVKSYIQNL
jgi:GTP-binding protein EngB required for normal cell division